MDIIGIADQYLYQFIKDPSVIVIAVSLC